MAAQLKRFLSFGIIFFGFFLGVNQALQAVTANNLYSDRVSVENQSDVLRDQKFSQALADVFIKVSGKIDITDNQQVAQAIKNPASWVKTYQYVPGNNNELVLKITFEAARINQLLDNINQPPWGLQRPTTLVWTVFYQNSWQFYNDSDENNPAIILNKDAQAYGLPMAFPLMDLQDFNTLAPEDIVNYKPQKIRLASARYDSPLTLLVAIKPADSSQWQASWTLLLPSAKVSWQNQSDSLQGLINDGMKQFAQNVFSRYPQAKTDVSAQKNVTLVVLNVDTVAQYSQLTNYLTSLSAVNQASVAQVSQEKVTFDLELNQPVSQLIQQLSDDKKLVQITNGNNKNLVYRVSNIS